MAKEREKQGQCFQHKDQLRTTKQQNRQGRKQGLVCAHRTCSTFHGGGTEASEGG